jgi:C1A family cysteine protease
LSQHAYSWRPSPPDPRNIQTAITPEQIAAHAFGVPHYDPRGEEIAPSVVDQLEIGSCTANAFRTALLRALYLNHQIPAEDLSRLHIYGGERTREGTFDEDSGAVGHDAFKFARKEGVALESAWPYGDGSTFDSEADFQRAQATAKYKIKQYSHPHPDAETFKIVLESGKYIAFGFYVYESFEAAEVARTGIVPLPKRGEQLLGGHEVVAVGFLTEGDQLYFICQNSWGTEWGQEGFFLFPAEYMFGYGTSDWRCIDLI